MSQPFDFDKALKALQDGRALTGKDGILTPLIKQLTEAALAAELDSHLAQDIEANRKNGSTKKQSKHPLVLLNWPRPAIVMALSNHNW